MEFSDTLHEFQSEIVSHFKSIFHIDPRHKLSNLDEELKAYFIEESKDELEVELKEQVRLASVQRIKINQEDKAKR